MSKITKKYMYVGTASVLLPKIIFSILTLHYEYSWLSCCFVCSREYDFCNVTYHFEMGPQKFGNQDSHSREATGATCYPGECLVFLLFYPLPWCCTYSLYIIILIIIDNKFLSSFLFVIPRGKLCLNVFRSFSSK